MFTLQNLILVIIGLAVVLLIISIAKKLIKFIVIAIIILAIIAGIWYCVTQFNIQFNFL